MSAREAPVAAEACSPARVPLRMRLDAWLLRHEPRLLAFNLIVTLITAWTSVTFFHPDEHYQIVELVGLKLGFNPERELPWEYAARARPWLQPALYYLLLKPLTYVGVQDRFLLAFVLRLCSGLLAYFGLVTLVRTSGSWFHSDQARSMRLRWLTLTGCVPYLAVRTSSENACGSFFLLGLAVLMRELPAESAATRRLPVAQALLGGVLLGLAFEARFQVAFMILGLGLWLAGVARIGVRSLLWVAVGTLCPIVIALFVDRWGYGEWVFPPWSYARVNLLEGRAAEYGTKSLVAYLHITLANIFAPVVILSIVGLTLCWIRRPRHVVTFVTLPFVLGHSVIGHKEERFLFPILLLGLVGAALGYQAQPEGTARHGLARAAAWLAARFRALRATRLYVAFLVWNAFGMLLLTAYPLGWRPHLVFARWVHEHVPGPVHFVADDPKILPSYPFYRRAAWHLHATHSVRSGAVFGETAGPVYFLRREPFTPVGHEELSADMELVFSEFPGAHSDWLRSNVFPWLGRLRDTGLARGLAPKRFTWLSVYRIERP